MRRRGGSGRLVLPLLLLALLCPGAARAERGAVTVEASGGIGTSRVDPPGLAHRAGHAHLVGPTFRLAAIYAVDHGFELGFTVPFHAAVKQSVEDIIVRERRGTYVETLNTGAILALLRLSGLGLVRRGFLELSGGYRYFRHGQRDHLRPPDPPDTAFTSYDLGLEPVTNWAPTLGVSAGWFWSGDRLGLGLRGSIEVARVSDVIAPVFGLHLFSAWSFYP